MNNVVILIHFFINFRIDIELVVRENDGSRALSAKESVSVINQEKVKKQLKLSNFKVSKIALGKLKKPVLKYLKCFLFVK